MAIERKFGGTKQMKAGEYKVTVTDIKFGKSKSDKNMWTITFANDHEETIKGFYVPDVAFHLKQLKEIKAVCGLDEKDGPDKLISKRLGIAVEEQEPDQDGKTFMRITGYGKESQVDESNNYYMKAENAAHKAFNNPPSRATDEIPF